MRIGQVEMTGKATMPVDATLMLLKAPKPSLVKGMVEILVRE